MGKNSWFEVDRNGLRGMFAGKNKDFILRELVQNVWDEPATFCRVETDWDRGKVRITVEDDSPIGFRNISDAYRLFGWCYKRALPEKRGRYNIGEKVSFSICDYALVETTTGTVEFTKEGRQMKRKKRGKGTKVTVELRMKKEEYEEMLSKLKYYLVPKEIKFTVNGGEIPYKEPFKVVKNVPLLTEIEENGGEKVLKKTVRKTSINVHKKWDDVAFIFEMGIPVQEIDCDYSIDVQQKVPLSIDREMVLPSFLRDVYAEVLNTVHDDIEEEQSSQVWIREGMSDNRIQKEAVDNIIHKRYGEKVCIANPSDKRSIDEALAHGYNVVYGNEQSKEEWKNIRRDELMQSSSALFGVSFTDSEKIKPTENMLLVGELAKKIAKRLLRIDIGVVFVKCPKASNGAQWDGNSITFNISRLGSGWFWEKPVSAVTIDLILHEIGHKAGYHTQASYHELLTKMAGELVMIALNEPEWFDGEGGE